MGENMENIEDKEWFLLKELSTRVVTALTPSVDKIKKQCELVIVEIEEIEKDLKGADSGIKINEFSKSSEEKRNELIRLLAIKNRIDQMIDKNNSRIAFINNKLNELGLLNQSVDKKQILEIEKQESGNISMISLNLNKSSEDGEMHSLEFLDGEVFELLNGNLDFSLEENKTKLKTISDENMLKIIKNHPASIASIPIELLVDSKLKKKVLKSLSTYVVDESKFKSIKDINKELGFLLEFKTEITNTPEDYIAGVMNMFNVQIKQFLLENAELEDQDLIKNKLKCNEKSELIPESKRIAVLSGGVAGEISADKDESEEERIAREKEAQKQVVKAEMDSLMQELQAIIDETKEIKEEKMEEIQKIHEEEIRHIQKQEESEKISVDEQELQRMMSKNRFDD